MSLYPTIMGSKLSNSQIVVVAIEAQCRRTKIRRLGGCVIFWDEGGGGMGSVMRHFGKILLQPNAGPSTLKLDLVHDIDDFNVYEL